ncbi:MAG: PPOX class F420-dependent oxidoreductase [Actinomycetota bacterium]|nr:PPOX class F420-dependent oxidoreductase [Actinomycetota bacterium]
MEISEAREYLESCHRAVMATRRSGGAVQLSPVTCALDANGDVVVSSRETAMKVKNLLRDPRVSLCVLDDGFFGEWIQLDGSARVVKLPDAMEGLVEYYRRVAGEHPDWDEYRAAMERERRVLVVVTIERAGPDRAG